MTTVAESFVYMTVEEYLEMEAKASVRHEYVDGRVFAMAGATRKHNVIAGNIFTVLHNFLDGSPCDVYMEAVKARVVAANCFYYPDVMVACDSYDEDSVYSDSPVFIVEVLSPATASIDRREKLLNYMKIPTVKEYLIVHQRRKRVELYRKQDSRRWDMIARGPGDELVIDAIPKGQLCVSVDAIYKNTTGPRFKDGALEVREELDECREWLSAEEIEALDW